MAGNFQDLQIALPLLSMQAFLVVMALCIGDFIMGVPAGFLIFDAFLLYRREWFASSAGFRFWSVAMCLVVFVLSGCLGSLLFSRR